MKDQYQCHICGDKYWNEDAALQCCPEYGCSSCKKVFRHPEYAVACCKKKKAIKIMAYEKGIWYKVTKIENIPNDVDLLGCDRDGDLFIIDENQEDMGYFNIGDWFMIPIDLPEEEQGDEGGGDWN